MMVLKTHGNLGKYFREKVKGKKQRLKWYVFQNWNDEKHTHK